MAVASAAVLGGLVLGARAQGDESLAESYPLTDIPAAAIAAGPATAGVVPQQPLSLSPLEGASAAPLIADPATLPPAMAVDQMGNDPYRGMPQVAPVSWISGPYFKAGVLSGVNGGFFKGMGQGYTIGGGYRQPLGPEVAGDRVFFDLGGSYQSVFGHNEQFVPENLVTTNRVTGVVTVDRLTDKRVANLREIRQASMNVAVGWYWGPPVDNRAADPQLRFATRLGGRWGHARGHFLEQQLEVDVDANNLVTPQTLVILPYERKDTFGGLFIGQEAILLNRDYAIGHVQWTVDAQYVNDWLELGGGSWKGSLGTVAITSGFMLSW